MPSDEQRPRIYFPLSRPDTAAFDTAYAETVRELDRVRKQSLRRSDGVARDSCA